MVPTSQQNDKEMPSGIDPQVRIALLEYRLGVQETLLKSIDGKIDALRIEMAPNAVVASEVTNLKDDVKRLQSYLVGVGSTAFFSLVGAVLALVLR